MSKIIFLMLLKVSIILCEIDEDDPLITFYDLKSKIPLLPPVTTVVPSSNNSTLNATSLINFIRLPFIGQPCGCESLQCGCCAGMAIQQFNFDQKMCMNFSYDPYEFAINMDMNMNENSIYQNQVSGKNPPPICLPVPLPPVLLPLGLEMCIKMFNIFTPGYNLHMCMDIMAQIQSAPIMILHFDCMRFGRDEIALLKPEDNGGLDQILGGGGGEAENTGGNGEVVYDPLFPESERKKNKTKN